MSDTAKFISFLESRTSLNFTEMDLSKPYDKEYLDENEIEITSFKLAKQNAIYLLKEEIKLNQRNLDQIKIMTLENWSQHSRSNWDTSELEEGTMQ